MRLLGIVEMCCLPVLPIPLMGWLDSYLVVRGGLQCLSGIYLYHSICVGHAIVVCSPRIL